MVADLLQVVPTEGLIPADPGKIFLRTDHITLYFEQRLC